MQKHHTPNRSKGSTKADLTPYEARASKIINLLFDDDTPSFVTNLLRTWLNELENETQVFYNVREVAEVALPLMLQRADELGLDPESGNSKFARRVVQDLEGYLDMSHDRAEERSRRSVEPAPEPQRNKLAEQRHAEWRLIAEHYAEVMSNPKTPRLFVDTLADMIVEVMNSANVCVTDPELLPITYPLAMQRIIEQHAAPEGMK